MQRLIRFLPFCKNKGAKNTEAEELCRDSADNFNALDFYNNLESYKHSVVNTELGENNNAIQNLQYCDLKKNEEEVKIVKSKDNHAEDIIKLDEKSRLMSEQIPNKLNSRIQFDNSRVYGGQYTSKGNLYYCSSQDTIGVYNSYDPYKMKKIKSVSALDVHWTITSMDTTEDEEYLVYSSISPILHIVDLQSLCKFHHKIDLSKDEEVSQEGYFQYFGIYNSKFSGDGKELV